MDALPDRLFWPTQRLFLHFCMDNGYPADGKLKLPLQNSVVGCLKSMGLTAYLLCCESLTCCAIVYGWMCM